AEVVQDRWLGVLLGIDRFLGAPLPRAPFVPHGERGLAPPIARVRALVRETAMPDVSFGSLLVVAAIAVGAPLLVGLFPRIRVPAVVFEIVAGIVVGPNGLGWVKIDLPVQILALMGLAFLLLLAGLEIDLDRLRGHLLRLA